MFLAGAKGDTSNKYEDLMDRVSYEFIAPFYAKYFAPWAVFNLLMLNNTLVAYITGLVAVSFVVFCVSMVAVCVLDKEVESQKPEAKQVPSFALD